MGFSGGFFNFFNSLLELPEHSPCRRLLLWQASARIRIGALNWFTTLLGFLQRVGFAYHYDLDSLPALDCEVLASRYQASDLAAFTAAGNSPRTCPSLNATLCTYSSWFMRPPGQTICLWLISSSRSNV